MLRAWAKELTVSMILDDFYREIAEEIGVGNFLKLLEIIGGATIYLPKTETILRHLRDTKICEEYNGYNALYLSRKYEVSQRWIQLIVKRYTDTIISK